MKLKTVHCILLGIVSCVLAIQINAITSTFTEYNPSNSSTAIEEEHFDFLPTTSSITEDQEKDIKEAGAININIYDEDGEVTDWGFWLINIFAPFFLLGEIVKLFVALVCLPFDLSLATDFFQGAIRNLSVMFPGLMFHTVLAFIR